MHMTLEMGKLHIYTGATLNSKGQSLSINASRSTTLARR
jgi:hypothetical protein